ncbi:NifB/NifX family molybdenum-iron cluster-binding protein [Clostridium sp. C8-1-8]|uniref:NifB/NifX family molybdenum-iron cluster-binding protein n=1 Tax=Clostridium sp. C8-1-8 TaxID=2698831 RepID=UPI00136B57AC|nr:NifB/NifX family molybdenum-iron cluster-binding protein [Clostridium sp. C8-1-8]
MKIALPISGDVVNSHFGRSESFAFATIEEKRILDIEVVSTEELVHNHDGLVNLFIHKGVEAVIANGIGQGAINAIKDKGFELIRGASGRYIDVLQQYIDGTLEDKNIVCNNHKKHSEK